MRTNSAGGLFEPGLSSAFFAKAILPSKKNWHYTIGLAHLAPHFIYRDYSGMQGFDDLERHSHILYLAIPAGIKFNFGSFYIHPEMGAAYNYHIILKTFITDSELNRLSGPETEFWSLNRFAIHMTPILSVGYSLKVKSFQIDTAAKGYLAFNYSYLHTYGVGFSVGVSI